MPPPHPSSRFALRAVAAPKSPAPRAQGAEPLGGPGDAVDESAESFAQVRHARLDREVIRAKMLSEALRACLER